MTDRGRPITPVEEAVTAGAVSFVVYLLTRTRDFGGDDTVFAMAVDAFLGGKGASMEVVHPHHPAFNLLVSAGAGLLRVVGRHPLVLDVGAAVAALAAGATVGVVVWLLRRDGIDEWTSLLGGMVLAVSAGMWQFATRMEVYTLAALAVAVWLAVVSAASPRAVPAGLAGAAAILAHAVTGLLVIPTAWRLRGRPWTAIAAVAIAVGLAGLALVGLLVVFLGVRSPAALLDIVVPRGAGEWMADRSPLDAWRTAAGLVSWEWYRAVPVLPPAMVRIAAACGTLALAVIGALVAVGVLDTVRRRRPLATTALLGVVTFLPVWLLWDVGNVEHAVAAAPLLAVVAAAGAAALPARWGRWGLATALGALVVANGLASALPQSRPENSRPLVIAGFVAGNVPAEAVVLSVGVDPRLRLSLGYLSGRRVLDLTRVADAARLEGRPAEQAWRWWVDQAAAAPGVWATPDVFDPASRDWAARYGIPGEAFDELAASWQVGERRRLAGDQVVGAGGFSVTELFPRIEAAGGRMPDAPR